MHRLFLLVGLFCFVYLSQAQPIKTRELYPFVQLQQGNFQEVLAYFDTHHENHYKLDFLLAQTEAAYQLGLYEKALASCQEIEKIKVNASTRYQVKIYLKCNDYLNAQKELLKNLQSTDKISLFDLFHDKAYEKIVNTSFLDSILKTNLYSATEKQMYRAEQLFAEENFTEALFLVQEIISRNNNLHQAFYLHSKISKSLNDHKKALETINKAIAITKIPGDYFYHRAKLYDEMEDDESALADIEKAIYKKPYQVNFYLLKSKLLYEVGRYSESIALVDDLLLLMPQNTSLLIIKAKSLYHDKKLLEALATINKSFEQKQLKEQYELRGDIYSATGTWEYAESDYSMYLDIDPFNGDIYAKKGYARLKAGDKQGACYDWEKGKRYGSIEAIKYWQKYCP
ncbi:MAG: tetratricopeptide repeat protein [Bacteroidales bacterium]